MRERNSSYGNKTLRQRISALFNSNSLESNKHIHSRLSLETPIAKEFYSIANAVDKYFQTTDALAVPLEMRNFFEKRLAIATAQMAVATHEFKFGDSEYHVNSDWHAKWKTSIPYAPTCTDITKRERSELEGILRRSAEYTIKLISNPAFHPDYQSNILCSLMDAYPPNLHYLIGEFDSEKENFQKKFYDDLAIFRFREQITSQTEKWRAERDELFYSSLPSTHQ